MSINFIYKSTGGIKIQPMFYSSDQNKKPNWIILKSIQTFFMESVTFQLLMLVFILLGAEKSYLSLKA